MKIGYTVWVANDGTNEWDILYSDNTKIIVTGNDGSVDGPNLYLDYQPTTLASGDIVAIGGYTNKRDGVYNIPTNKFRPTEFVTGGSKEVGKELWCGFSNEVYKHKI